MLAEEALVKILLDDAGVTALVDDRIYPGVLPQKSIASLEYPAIVFYIPPGPNRVRTERLDDRAFAGLTKSRYRFFCLAKGVVNGKSDYEQAKNLETALFLCLQGFTGTVSDDLSPVTTVEIDVILQADPPYYAELWDDETETRQVACDYDVSHSETIPT